MKIPCRICGSETAEQPWGGSICIDCGSISVTNLPSNEELERYYLNFNENYHGGGRVKGAKDRQIRYAYAYLKPLLSLNGGKRLLDIGSSTNPFPNIGVEHGYDMTILDYTKPEKIDSRVRFVQGRIDDSRIFEKLGKQRFDIVSAFQVIEHCSDPFLMAENMSRLCVNEGYVVLATPLVGSFSERYAPGKTPWFYPPEHIHLLSTKGTISLFRSVGCEIVSAKRYELNFFRWTLRYGLAYYEGFRGALLKAISHSSWVHSRTHKTSKVQEYIYYIFKKSATCQKP